MFFDGNPFCRITLGHVINYQAHHNGDKNAIIDVQKKRSYSYYTLKKHCDKASKGLIALGVNNDDKVGIWAPNVCEWVFSVCGAAKIGAPAVFINTNAKHHDLSYVLKDSDMNVLIFIDSYRDFSYADTLYTIFPHLRSRPPGDLTPIGSPDFPHLQHAVIISEDRYPGLITYTDFIAHGETISDSVLLTRESAVTPDDVLNFQYTSGTTGFPKGVMLTHFNIINNAYYTGATQNFSENEILCLIIPLFHSYGFTMSLIADMVFGATTVLTEYYKPLWTLESIQNAKCTFLGGVPTMWLDILEHPDFGKYDISSLKAGSMGGSPCPIELMKKLINMGLEISVVYGLSEASPLVTRTMPEDPIEKRCESIGRSLPYIEVQIRDPITGKELPRGQIGEIACKGYVVMKGYYKNPEATTAAIDSDGWLSTGDLGSMDEQGFIRIEGRLKEMIIRGGENIYPREIEEFLYNHPSILDVKIVGVPSRKYGEEVMAFIRLKEGKVSSEEEVKKFCENQIAHFKIPKYVEFVNEYPITASGKVQKHILREIGIRKLGLENEMQ